jgi:hypothetical protein
MIMAHLSTCIFVGHARQKTERCSVGRNSQQADKDQADDNVRRLDDQIRMIQYVRGRIGEDRDTILDMGRIPDYDTRFPMPSTPLQARASKRPSEGMPGSWQVPDGSTTAAGAFLPIASAMSNGDRRSPEYSPVTDDDERPEVKRLKQHENGITMTNSESFTPMTPPPEEKVEVKVEVKAENLFLANAAASLTT